MVHKLTANTNVFQLGKATLYSAPGQPGVGAFLVGRLPPHGPVQGVVAVIALPDRAKLGAQVVSSLATAQSSNTPLARVENRSAGFAMAPSMAAIKHVIKHLP